MKDGASTENPCNEGLVVLLRNICFRAMFGSHICSTKESFLDKSCLMFCFHLYEKHSYMKNHVQNQLDSL